MDLSVIILAAGKGTRMRSSQPKVLHRLAGLSLVEHVIQTSQQLAPNEIRLVYGHGAELVKQHLSELDLGWYLQAEQLGTGHAVDQAMPDIPDDHVVLVLYGDVPLIRAETLKGLTAAAQGDALGLLTVELANPTGYGRIVRDPDTGAVVRIVEQKDASMEEATLKEVNTGILAVKARLMRRWLARLDNDNSQGEYYLTDIIELAAQDGIAIATSHATSPQEVAGVNDKIQLAELERFFQRERADFFMRRGVTLIDPRRFDIRGHLTYGSDVEIDINVVIEGNVTLGDNVRLGPNVYIKDSVIGSHTEIYANCVIENARVGEHGRIGPFARLRPEANLYAHVHVGNFVEIKKSTVGNESKVNHLSYVGDARIGERVNVGAGSITCNYDGANKHLTEIGDDVFVGSNTALVAPIVVGDGASIGAGSTLAKAVPADKLTLTRARKVTIDGWKRPTKNKT